MLIGVVNASGPRSLELQEHIDRLQEAIATFERTTAHLRERRRGAADHLMVELDERLAVNQRTLECLKRSLDLARLELTRANHESASPFVPRSCGSPDQSRMAQEEPGFDPEIRNKAAGEKERA